MAQGLAKIGKSKKTQGGEKRKAAKVKSLQKKGPKHHGPKRAAAVAAGKEVRESTKSINRKNERIMAAKAVGDGTRFFLNDIKETGKKEGQKQVSTRHKKEQKTKRVTDRLREQLQKLAAK